MTAIQVTFEIYTPPDVAKLLGWSTQHVRALIENGSLPAVNVSTKARPRWIIRRVDLEQFLTPTAKQEQQKPKKTRQRIDADVAKVF